MCAQLLAVSHRLEGRLPRHAYERHSPLPRMRDACCGWFGMCIRNWEMVREVTVIGVSGEWRGNVYGRNAGGME
jgi:hypothetical protein